MNSKTFGCTVTIGILGLALSQGASSAFAGNKGQGGGNHGSNGNSGHNGNHNGNGGNSFGVQASNHSQSSNKVIHTNHVVTDLHHVPILDPGIGNGHSSDHHHSDHHSDHHDHHHGHHNFGPRYIGYGVPAYYPYRVNTYPVVITAPQSPVQLVNGVDLKLIDVRLADNGDAARNLGPRYRVKIANGGNRSAGNFQVTVVGSKDEEIVDELPRSTVDVAGVPSGKSISIDVRLPMEATTMIDGNPFNILTVVIDSSEMVDEATEENNAGMLERTKIAPVNVASR